MSTTDKEPTTKLTYDDYVLIPNDGKRHEIIQGRHYINPAPSTLHQKVSRRIQFQLYSQLELKGLAQVINAPVDVQLSNTDIVQPDLVVVLTENQIITPAKIKGAPDLVVEILSPSNRKYDQELKKHLYQQHRVPEYWIVDPENQSVDQNRLTGNEYVVTVVTEQICFERVSESVSKSVSKSVSATVDLKAVWK